MSKHRPAGPYVERKDSNYEVRIRWMDQTDDLIVVVELPDNGDFSSAYALAGTIAEDVGRAWTKMREAKDSAEVTYDAVLAANRAHEQTRREEQAAERAFYRTLTRAGWAEVERG